MSKYSIITGIVFGLMTLALVSCSNDEDDSVSIGDYCEIAQFTDFCKGDTLIHCVKDDNHSAHVYGTKCDEVCAYMNGTAACRYLCAGTKAGDVTYSCDSYDLISRTCVSADNGSLIAVKEERYCTNGCVTEGTTSKCK